MEDECIIGLDPGTTTGVATCRVNFESAKFECKLGQLGPYPHNAELYAHLIYNAPDIIVCESFEYRNMSRTGLVLDSVKYIGVVELYEQGERDVRLVMQTAATGKVQHGKGLVKPANVRALGLWSSNSTHAIDALGHVLYYILTKRQGTPLAQDLLQRGWR